MGFLSRAVAERKSDPLAVWQEILRRGTQSKSGNTVNLNSALKVSVAFSCVQKIANGCSQVPFKLFQSVETGGIPKTVAARDHRLYDLLTVKPNNWTTSYEFRETLVLHAAFGNAYVFINRGMGGRVLELIILNPARVTKIQNEDYSIVYEIEAKNGAKQVFPAESIWHVRGPSWDGVVGMDLLTLAREALGLAISTEETHARLHEKGIRASGTYSVEGTLDAKQYSALKDWIVKEFAGAENSGAPMILDRGAKWLQQSISGVDSQHLETRKFQIEEVCRFFNVMPIMVGYNDKTATYASAEQMFLAHVVHTLSPWYARIEQSADANLLTEKERKAGYYFKFMAAGLLRGSHQGRSEYYAKALGSGGSPAWMTADEVRELEELNPMGGAASALPIAMNVPTATPNPNNESADGA